MAPSHSAEHFDIHASVVFQLGESLITDSVQALVELVKNSYDADASYCKLTISTEEVTDPESPFHGAGGSIVIEDDGVGMAIEDIRRGWLTISNSVKREFKDRKLTTKKGRTPLGDKGLGRLGTQRLGDNVEMFSRTQGSPGENHVWFSWKDFVGKTHLSEVNIGREERHASYSHGTKLIISQLREPEIWKGDAVVRLQARLSQMISPYRTVREFVVYASVDGKQLELLEITEKLRQAAQLHYYLNYDGDLFRVSGRARLSYIKPETNPDRALFESVVDNDGGQRLFNHLRVSKRASEFSFQKSSHDGWFVDFSTANHLEDIDGIELIDGRPADPGPFRGEIDFFSLGAQSSAEQTAYGTSTEYRQAVETLSGVKVYRDGFGIRVAADWLDLGKQWTKARSYYTLKPHNTLGYIAITARDNRQLEETTDREGFKDNPYYRNFYSLLSSFVVFSENAQGLLRRGWTEYKKSIRHAAANVPEDTKPEALSAKLTEGMAKAARYRTALSQVSLRLKNSIDNTKRAVDSARESGNENGNIRVLESILAEMSAAVRDAEEVSTDVQVYLDEISKMESVGGVLTSQIETLREQIQQVHEIIALGLTAESISHETGNITSQLAQRNEQIIRYLRSNSVKDTRISAFTEYVRTSVGGLRRQLAFLAPSLQYVREKRELIDMEEFAGELLKHYTVHFASTSIQVLTKMKKGQNFKIQMNKGKLIQILDNLLLNSEYWLKEDLRMGRLSLGSISIELSKPYVRVSDNGKGVEPRIEDSLFEPFVTAKAKGVGRGLGLYIARQLLDAEGCNIRLLPQRNAFNRLFSFEVDLTGVLVDKP
ncbi:MAG TPA: sensor histidine kinase [Candidatus Acidoferrum sp.]|nr:sensor histidine kinase [Candidatus Acidoferrum sp.]